MNLFEDGFEEPDENFPESKILDAITVFEKATNGLASLSVVELGSIGKITSKMDTTFQFQTLLTSRFLSSYSFDIMTFGYDVTIYPVIIDFQSEIAKEIGVKGTPYKGFIMACRTEEEFLEVIEAIFNTNKFKKTVGGLLKVARAKSEDRK